MKLSAFLIFFLFTQLIPLTLQKKIIVHVTPADATISIRQTGSEELRQVGIGTATIVIPRNTPVAVVLQKAGYADLKIVYSTLLGEKIPKEDFFTLKDRQVRLKVWPADATIICNGEELEKAMSNVIIKEGEQVNVEVKKPGFITVKKSYKNEPGAEPPPIFDEIKLKDRVIHVVASPSDSKILVDNKLIGTGSGDIIIPLDGCAVVKIVREGYSELEQTFCNKEGGAELALKESFTLQDRLVMVKTAPDDASISIKGQVVATGSFIVKVPKGECVEVTAVKEGALPVSKSYCNQDNAPPLPAMDTIKLAIDVTFNSSSPADFVNINNIVEINPATKDDDAWKIMSQIVMNYFDVIEVTDKATGYLRTAWTVKSFPNNTIRTRVIVKVADSSTLKYVVKLCSESSGKSGSKGNDDSLFSEWDRVLETYKNLVSDIQTRLK